MQKRAVFHQVSEHVTVLGFLRLPLMHYSVRCSKPVRMTRSHQLNLFSQASLRNKTDP